MPPIFTISVIAADNTSSRVRFLDGGEMWFPERKAAEMAVDRLVRQDRNGNRYTVVQE